MTKILFLCTGNSCRSQMAEGFARALKSNQFEAYSAGIETHGLNPNAVRVMAEVGIDISAQQSTHVDQLRHISTSTGWSRSAITRPNSVLFFRGAPRWFTGPLTIRRSWRGMCAVKKKRWGRIGGCATRLELILRPCPKD